ncbi:MAG: hypothetical protein IPK02_00660 [Candidatus Accumulibacter sp.]|uniref:Uncharacterized protein n=1 Tax=Candidatus Accumulibacter affinis TaxID=2954384 RepID=A0A935W386_9PROT|nr:hypothetical protein [Candidatus Accumulibacter affinis]
MGYLDQLKKSFNTPEREPKEPKKPKIGGSLGFLGPLPGVFEKIHASDEPAEAANERPFGASRWLRHFADRNPVEVAFSPKVSHAEALAIYPSALAAEPAVEIRRQPDALVTARQESSIRAWLTQIGELDAAAVGDVLAQCRQDEVARQYFLARVGEDRTDDEVDDRRTCTQCLNLRGGVCSIASPGGLVSAVRGYRPALLEILQRCHGFAERETQCSGIVD